MHIYPGCAEHLLKVADLLNDGELLRHIMFLPSYTTCLSRLDIGFMSHWMMYVLSENVRIVMTFGN